MRTYAKSLWSYNPIPYGCVLYLPLWALSGPVFKSVDSFGHECTVTGAVKVSTGRDFDGLDDVIDLGSPTALDNIFDGGGTYMAWVYLDTFGEEGEGKIIDRAITSFLVSDRTAVRTYTKSIFFSKIFDGTNGEWMTGDNTLLASAEHLVAVSYNADSVDNNPIFYINGVLSTTYEETTPTQTRTSDAGDTQYIGNTSNGTRAYDGKIKEVWGYKRILNAAEHLYTYQATKGR